MSAKEEERVIVESEEVVVQDWEVFLANQEVDRFRLMFVDIVKMERAAIAAAAEGTDPTHAPCDTTMTISLPYFLKLPDVIRPVMKRVLTTDEIAGINFYLSFDLCDECFTQ
jgi:hypothetical protein